MPVLPVLRKLREQGWEIKTSLGDISRQFQNNDGKEKGGVSSIFFDFLYCTITSEGNYYSSVLKWQGEVIDRQTEWRKEGMKEGRKEERNFVQKVKLLLKNNVLFQNLSELITSVFSVHNFLGFSWSQHSYNTHLRMSLRFLTRLSEEVPRASASLKIMWAMTFITSRNKFITAWINLRGDSTFSPVKQRILEKLKTKRSQIEKKTDTFCWMRYAYPLKSEVGTNLVSRRLRFVFLF